jgi:glycosyltransferase 2 family protein
VSTQTASHDGSSSTLRQAERSWRAIVFAPLGDGQRRRRGSDALRLAIAIFIVVCAVAVLRSNSRPEDVLAHVLSPPPDGLRWLVDVFWIGGTFGTIALLVFLAALARRWNIVRDLVTAAAGTLVISGLLVLGLGASGGRPPSIHFDGFVLSFPVLHVAVAMSVLTAGLPYLSRTVQRLLEAIVLLAILATVVAGHGLPANVIGSMAIGWGVAAVVHLVWGSPLGLPSAEELRAALSDIGIDTVSVAPSKYQTWGVGYYDATTQDDKSLTVSLYGRDAADAQLFRKLYRLIFYRDSGPALSLTRIHEVEHESSITQLAARAGVRVPQVINASEIGPSHDAALIELSATGTALSDLEAGSLSDAALDDMFHQMLTLRSARIAHCSLNPHVILVDVPTSSVSLTDFSNGVSNAGTFLLDQDLAGATACAAIVAGPEHAARSLVRVVPHDVIAGTLTHLRRAGLDPLITLDQVRAQAARDAGIEVPKLVEPRRLSWNQVLVAVGSLVGGWALIAVLINASHSIETIRHAQWGWVVTTALLCWASYLAGAVCDVGAVPGSLPLGRLVGLELANSFTTLAGGNAAVLATEVRFYQQQGFDTTVAVSSSALVSAASLLVKVLLFLIALPIAWSSFHFGKTLHQGNHAGILWTLLAVIVFLGVVLAAIFAIPRLRRLAEEKLRPKLSSVVANFKTLATTPVKLFELFGGQLVAQLLIIIALGTALHAFNAHLSLAELIIASTVAGTLASASPAGGGMGVAEAGMILALTAAGVPSHQATAAVFVQRTFTAYLPPIVGWFTLMWMRRKEYL